MRADSEIQGRPTCIPMIDAWIDHFPNTLNAA
jgi:hypothetical protein